MKTVFKNLGFIPGLLPVIALCLSQAANAAKIAPYEGLVAPDFELVQQDGSKFRLSDYRGKQAVYVVFWNTWCSFCMKKIPKLKEAETNLSQQIKIIAINTSREDSIAEMVKFQQHRSINYSLVFDHQSKVSDLYRIGGVPTEFIVDINGIIQHRDGVPKQLRQSLAIWNTPATNKVTSKVAAQCKQEKGNC